MPNITLNSVRTDKEKLQCFASHASRWSRMALQYASTCSLAVDGASQTYQSKSALYVFLLKMAATIPNIGIQLSCSGVCVGGGQRVRQ